MKGKAVIKDFYQPLRFYDYKSFRKEETNVKQLIWDSVLVLKGRKMPDEYLK
jgi:hypothetical protein